MGQSLLSKRGSVPDALPESTGSRSPSPKHPNNRHFRVACHCSKLDCDTSKTDRGLLWSQLVCAAAKVCTKKQTDGLLNHRQPYRRPHVTAMVQLQFGIKEQEPCSWPCVCDDLHSGNPVSSSLVEFRFWTRWIFAGKRMRSGS